MLGAEHAVIVGVAGQRGEDLLAVDDPAALDRAGLACRRRRRRPPRRRLPRTAAHRSRRRRRCGGSATRAGARARRGSRRPCRGRRRAGRTTASSRHACSRSAPSRRSSARSRRRRSNRRGSRRRARPRLSGCRWRGSRPCAGRDSSRSGSWPRGRGSRRVAAKIAWPMARAFAASAVSSSLKRKAAGSNSGGSRVDAVETELGDADMGGHAVRFLLVIPDAAKRLSGIHGPVPGGSWVCASLRPGGHR